MQSSFWEICWGSQVSNATFCERSRSNLIMVRNAWSVITLILWLRGLIGALLRSKFWSQIVITRLLVSWTWSSIQPFITTTRTIAWRFNIIRNTTTVWLLTLWALALVNSRVRISLWLEDGWVSSSYYVLPSRFFHNIAVAHVYWWVLSPSGTKLWRGLFNHRHFLSTFHSEVYVHGRTGLRYWYLV